jgi:hypothetical protein
MVGIYFEKTGYRHKWHKWHKWHKLYFTQQQRTDNNDLVFKCCIWHKIIVIYIKNFVSCRIFRLSAVRNECSFYSVQVRWNRTVRKKIRTAGNPSSDPIVINLLDHKLLSLKFISIWSMHLVFLTISASALKEVPHHTSVRIYCFTPPARAQKSKFLVAAADVSYSSLGSSALTQSSWTFFFKQLPHL